MAPPFSSQLPFRGSLWVWLSLPAPPSLVPCGFGHRCPPPSLDSLRVWSLLVDPSFRSLWFWSPLRFHLPWFPVDLVTVAGSLPWFPVGLVTVARLLSLGSLRRWSTLLVPHPLFPMGLVTVTSPPPLVPHWFGQRYQLPLLFHEFFIRLCDLKG